MIDPNLISFLLFLLLILIFIPLAISELVLLIIAAYKDYKNKRVHWLKKYFIQLLIVVAIFFALFQATFLINKEPSNEELIKNYQENKTEFNTLVKRIQVDQKKGLERIDDDWTRPADIKSIGLTEQDLGSYREEFKKLNTPRGFYSFPGRIDFVAHTSGISISGSSKGYLYSLKEPQNYFKENCGYSLKPFKDLKEYKGCNGYASSYTIYQQIDKNWYIYDELED